MAPLDRQLSGFLQPIGNSWRSQDMHGLVAEGEEPPVADPEITFLPLDR